MIESDIDTPPQPPPLSAQDLLKALHRLHAEGLVEIRVEAKRLTHLDSPVAIEADGNIWVYGFVLAAGLAWWRLGAVAGGATLVAGIVVYLTFGRAYIHRRIERRVRTQALASLEKWRKLWTFPGLTLVAAQGGAPNCASPDGNWMGFVRALLPDGT
ncbi:MAG TPA: hypothetical protein VET85_17070 [Stellaceae bacterium]|nr:hypothetical protein [Stellaceae bacterium]